MQLANTRYVYAKISIVTREEIRCHCTAVTLQYLRQLDVT